MLNIALYYTQPQNRIKEMMTTYERIIKRKNGDSVKLEITAFFSSGRSIEYSASAKTRSKGKRLWRNVLDIDAFGYRKLSMKDRPQHEEDLVLTVVTPKELYAAKLALWERLKPEE
jgi:hypothetical protein